MRNTWQSLVKKKVKAIGETQEGLAEKLNVTQGSIAHWLSGRRKPDIDIVASIIKAVEIKSITISSDGSADETKSQLNENNLKVINITGDSMQGTFENGDIICIDITVNQFQNDGIYVFTFENRLYVRRLQMIKNKLVVISDNKKYRDWEILTDEFDQLGIHGKVVLSQSMMLKKHG